MKQPLLMGRPMVEPLLMERPMVERRMVELPMVERLTAEVVEDEYGDDDHDACDAAFPCEDLPESPTNCHRDAVWRQRLPEAR